MTIGKNVKTIGIYAFYGCQDLENVYYTGSEKQWNALEIGVRNNELLNANIRYDYSIPLGDANADSVVDNLDAALILKYDAGL